MKSKQVIVRLILWALIPTSIGLTSWQAYRYSDETEASRRKVMQEWSKGLIDRINFAQLYEAKCVKQVTLVKDKSMDLAHEIRRPATFQECLSYVAGDDLEPTRISDADTKELTVAMETATNSVPVPTPLRWF